MVSYLFQINFCLIIFSGGQYLLSEYAGYSLYKTVVFMESVEECICIYFQTIMRGNISMVYYYIIFQQYFYYYAVFYAADVFYLLDF